MDEPINYAKLKKTIFPIFTKDIRNVFVANTCRSTCLFIQYKLNGTINDPVLEGKLMLPRGLNSISAVINIKKAHFDTIVQRDSIVDNDIVRQYMSVLAKALYSSFTKKGSLDYILTNETYHRTVFLVKTTNVIGIGTNFKLYNNENGNMLITVKNLVGPYISMFNNDSDQNTTIIIKDKSYNVHIETVEGDSVTAEIIYKNNILDNLKKKCESIAKKYSKNYLGYFIDREDKKKGEEDGFGIFD